MALFYLFHPAGHVGAEAVAPMTDRPRHTRWYSTEWQVTQLLLGADEILNR